MRYTRRVRPLLLKISKILPKDYAGAVLLDYFKQYYPTEWNELSGVCKEYREKDEFLKSVRKKERYKPPTPEDFFFRMPVVRDILMATTKQAYAKNYDSNKRERDFETFCEVREKAIRRREQKLRSMRSRMGLYYTQKIEPLYADAFIKAYHRRGATTAEKLEIAIDLAKYECPKVERFFYKLNDSERNDQIRHWAFRYLQACGKYVRLRKSFKGKRKAYMTEIAEFKVTPADLVQRFSSTSTQNQMVFDVFVSHSILDRLRVQEIINKLNREYHLTCYCDWGVDNDFLSRDLVGENTRKALERRLRQSRTLLLVDTPASKASKWVPWEVSYFRELGKPMYHVGPKGEVTPIGFKDISELKSFHQSHH